jgi:hypothetical protein
MSEMFQILCNCDPNMHLDKSIVCTLWHTRKLEYFLMQLTSEMIYSIDVLVCINMFSSKYLIVQKNYCMIVQKTYSNFQHWMMT